MRKGGRRERDEVGENTTLLRMKEPLMKKDSLLGKQQEVVVVVRFVAGSDLLRLTGVRRTFHLGLGWAKAGRVAPTAFSQ